MNSRHECMDEYALPFIWLAVVMASLALTLSIVALVEMHLDRKAVSRLLADCANGKLVPLGNDAVMRCEVTPLTKGR